VEVDDLPATSTYGSAKALEVEVDGDDSIGVVVAVARITMRLIAWLDPAPEGSDEEAQLERLESGWLNPPQALETVRNIVQAELSLLVFAVQASKHS
jgi:hypothetical protein